MRVGIFTFSTDRDMSPARLAREVEERGLDDLMFTEHSHIPVTRETPYPDVYGGGALPDFYRRTYDPFVACSFAVAATSRIQIGTGICLLALRDPVFAAKEIASVDRLSGGRFVFGVGFGWNADEFVTHGASFADRHAVVEEKVALMRRLWSDEVASFDGVHVQLRPSWAWPKPVQPTLPVIVGGNGPRSLRHAARWADGWYPTTLAGYPSPAAAVGQFRAQLERNGRDPDGVPVGVAIGDIDEATLHAYRDAGVERVDIACITGGDDDLLARLDAVVALQESLA